MRRLSLVLVLAMLLALFPLAPGFALAAAPPETRAAEHEGLPESAEGAGVLEEDVRTTPVIEAQIPFNMIGFHLPDGVDGVTVRTAKSGESWSEWVELEVDVEGLDGPDPGSDEARGAVENATEPLWAGEADLFQVRVEGGTLEEVDATIVDATGLSEPIAQRIKRHLTPRQSPAEASSLGRPNIVTRAGWGADESWVKSSPSIASKLDHVVVHHTAGSNNYSRADGPALVRSIYHWHTKGQGWNDVGYNMLIDRYGVVYEGRRGGLDKAVVGAHARGFNSGSFGVSVIGDFDVADIPTAAYNSLVQTVGWKMRLHGLDVSPTRTFVKNGKRLNAISGHRDVGATTCPGRYVVSRMPDLRNRVATGGMPSTGGTPVVGDWNGDGHDTPGLYARGAFFLSNSNAGNSYPDIVVPFGRDGDQPIVGDWNGNGRTGIGVVRAGTWMLRDTATPGSPTRQFVFGRLLAGDRPIIGDWNRSGTDGVGIVRSGGEWHQRHSLSAGNANQMFVFGRVAGGDSPVTGDWNGDGRSTVGIMRGDTWMLRDRNSAGDANREIRFGRTGDVPIVGDWDGDGKQTIGVVRGRTWYLNDGIRNGYAQSQFRY